MQNDTLIEDLVEIIENRVGLLQDNKPLMEDLVVLISKRDQQLMIHTFNLSGVINEQK